MKAKAFTHSLISGFNHLEARSCVLISLHDLLYTQLCVPSILHVHQLSEAEASSSLHKVDRDRLRLPGSLDRWLAGCALNDGIDVLAFCPGFYVERGAEYFSELSQ